MVWLSNGVEYAKEGTADTPGEAVVNTFFAIFNTRVAWKSLDSPRITVFKGEPVD
jgi:hypothetical protein